VWRVREGDCGRLLFVASDRRGATGAARGLELRGEGGSLVVTRGTRGRVGRDEGEGEGSQGGDGSRKGQR
jgi:hypothetical protein